MLRPWPAVVEVPKDVFYMEVLDLDYSPSSANQSGPDPEEVRTVADALLDAERPGSSPARASTTRRSGTPSGSSRRPLRRRRRSASTGKAHSRRPTPSRSAPRARASRREDRVRDTGAARDHHIEGDRTLPARPRRITRHVGPGPSRSSDEPSRDNGPSQRPVALLRRRSQRPTS